MKTTRRFFTTEVIPQVRVRTTDAAPRTRDTWLNAEQTKNYAVELGLVWTGNGRPEQSALRVDPSLLGAEPEWGERFNAESRRLWAEGTTEPTADTAARTVDRAAAAAHARAATNATDVRTQADCINAAARAFWGSAA